MLRWFLVGLLLIIPYELVWYIWDEHYAHSSLGIPAWFASSPPGALRKYYTYVPLQDANQNIRLVVLEPGTTWDPLECSLIEVSFKQKPIYEALSYMWGDQSVKTLISVTSKIGPSTKRGTLEIGDNLWSAIYSLRDPKTPKTFWIDVICINQSDLQEKSYQVPLMTIIYSRAKEVVIWLGPQRLPNTVLELVDSNKIQSDDMLSLIMNDSRWIKRLLYSEYWRRVWIVQEVSMATTVRLQIGDTRMRWNDLIALARTYQNINPTNILAPIFSLERLRFKRYSGETYALKTLVRMFRENACSVVRDKIYAFVGMAADRIDVTFNIDYQESIVDVYHRFISSYARYEGNNRKSRIELSNLAALTRHVLGRRSIEKDVEYLSVAPRQPFEKRFYSWWKNATYIIEDGQEKLFPLIVPLLGYPLAYILDGIYVLCSSVSYFFFATQNPKGSAWEHQVREDPALWLPITAENPTLYGSKFMLTCKITSEIMHIGPSYDTIISSSTEAIKWASSLRDHLSDTNTLQKARELNTRFFDVLYDPENSAQDHIIPLPQYEFTVNQSPRLFLGERYDISVGLAPDGAAVGDLICQLWNSNASAVLRLNEKARDEGEYRLIGRAGVVTTTEGRGWDVPKADEFSLPQNEEKFADFQVDMRTLTRLSMDSGDFSD